MTFQDIATALENFAEAAWQKVKDEAIAVEQKIEPVVESAFSQAVQQFGQLASDTVINLMTAAYNELTGGAKLNLTVTTIVDAAEKAGVQIAEADGTALAKAAYTAVIGKAPGA